MVERTRQAFTVPYEEMTGLGAALGAMADLREQETLSLCKDILEASFADSIGHSVIDVFLNARRPLHLIDIAVQCGQRKRSVLPNGTVRAVIDRLMTTGMIMNLGTPERPRLVLNRDDGRVRILKRMYGPAKLGSLS